MEAGFASRRAFLKAAGATALGLTLGRHAWAFDGGASPFGPLQALPPTGLGSHDPFLRLAPGFKYRIVAETGMPLPSGSAPTLGPQFPDLNVVFPKSDGSVVLSTSHEVPEQFPLSFPMPTEDYDRVAGGAITSVHLDANLSFLDGAHNAGGMSTNCSGSGTPWGTVLTGEETTATFEAEHGFVWEVDIDQHRKVRLDGLGKFEHETAVVHAASGVVYLTEDAGSAFLYRFVPATPATAFGDLAGPGVLQAFCQATDGTGSWVTLNDPMQANAEAAAAGARTFARLEGGAFDPFLPDHFYFTETADPADGGRVWRLDVATNELRLWVQGAENGALTMPDNLAFDAAGNLFVCEDNEAAGPLGVSNRIVVVDRTTGALSTFAEVVQYWQTPNPPGNVADEVTGPAFWHRPDGTSVLFVNLQRAQPTMGYTVAIEGPFAAPSPVAGRRAPVAPRI